MSIQINNLNQNFIENTIDNFFDNKSGIGNSIQNDSQNYNSNNLNIEKEKLNSLISKRNIQNIENKSNHFLDIHQKYKEISFKEGEFKKNNYIQEKMLGKYLDNYVRENLENEETSDLSVKKYDKEDNEIYITNTDEYKYIRDFVFKGRHINEKYSKKVSRCGNIILDSYYRFLDSRNRIDLEINEFLKSTDFDEYKVIEQNNIEIGFILLNLQDQYKFELFDRYKYFGTLIILRDLQEIGRIPLYLDFNLDFCILTYRKIIKPFFSCINISKLLSFIDIETQSNIIRLTMIEKFNVFSYRLHQKGIIKYYEYNSYKDEDFLDKLYNLEEESY